MNVSNWTSHEEALTLLDGKQTCKGLSRTTVWRRIRAS
jgi:hypothetical protein